MTDMQVEAEPQADEYAVDVRLKVPNAAYKRLRWVAEQKYQSTPARVAEAVLKAWLGGQFEVEKEPEEPKRRRFTDPGVQEELLQLVEAGMSKTDIAAIFGIERRLATKWIAAVTGVEVRPRPVAKVKSRNSTMGNRPFADRANVETFHRMYGEGATDAAIAKTLGCSETAVARQRRMRGMLPQSERQYGAAS